MNIPTQHSSIVADCEQAACASSQDLMALAVARGCRHYAPMVFGHHSPPRSHALSHEVLACALLRFPMPDGFDAFRCGVMVLSDLNNQPISIASAAEYFGVADRVGYVVRVGLAHDDKREFWEHLRLLFPRMSDSGLLPGPSRLMSETRMSGEHRGPVRIWLRTAYHS